METTFGRNDGFGLAQCGDAGTLAALRAKPQNCGDDVDRADAVDGQAGVALELADGMGGQWAEDSVDTTTIEAQPRQVRLEFVDVIAAQVGRCEIQHSIAERPGCLDQRGPRCRVAHTVGAQTPRCLEVDDRLLGDAAIQAVVLDLACKKARAAQATLQIADGGRAEAGRQWEGVRNSDSSWRSAPLPLAPTMRLTISPLSKTRSVGMLMTL